MQVKSVSFAEHSPMLNDITSVKGGWKQVNIGLWRMYQEEVLRKYPIVQHFIFTDLLSPRLVKPVERQYAMQAAASYDVAVCERTCLSLARNHSPCILRCALCACRHRSARARPVLQRLHPLSIRTGCETITLRAVQLPFSIACTARHGLSADEEN